MAIDCHLLLHIGPPRTATTTLQKHVFPNVSHHLCLQKKAYRYHLKAAELQGCDIIPGQGYVIDYNQMKMMLGSLRETGLQAESSRDTLYFLVSASSETLCMRSVQQSRMKKLWYQLLVQSLRLAAETVLDEQGWSGLVIASEALSNTTVGIRGSLKAVADQDSLQTSVLCSAWREGVHGPIPHISFCLRDPIDYILSRYLRHCANRSSKDAPGSRLSPEQWLAVQAEAFSSQPQLSALFPAFHLSFTRFHARHGFIRPYGFEELLATDDVFALIGLDHEAKFSFSSLPRENRLRGLSQSAENIKVRIEATLKELQLFEQLRNEQIYR